VESDVDVAGAPATTEVSGVVGGGTVAACGACRMTATASATVISARAPVSGPTQARRGLATTTAGGAR
jgi:hypothetical protein